MLLRHLVNAWLRQAAQERLRDAVSEIAHGAVEGAAPQEDAADVEEHQPSPPSAAFLFALGVESGGFVDLLEDSQRRRFKTRTEHHGLLDGRRVVAVDSGVGAEAAARATQRVITRYQPSWIISAGFAAALREDLRRGHVLMADSIVDEDGLELSVGFKLDPQAVAATRGLHVGRLLSVENLVRSAEDKRALAEKYGAAACDMETAAAAEVCRRHETRFLAVRVITDALDDELPPELETLVHQKSTAAKLGAATGALFRRPSSVKDMWRLREEAIKASDRLAKFLRGVLPQLP